MPFDLEKARWTFVEDLSDDDRQGLLDNWDKLNEEEQEVYKAIKPIKATVDLEKEEAENTENTEENAEADKVEVKPKETEEERLAKLKEDILNGVDEKLKKVEPARSKQTEEKGKEDKTEIPYYLDPNWVPKNSEELFDAIDKRAAAKRKAAEDAQQSTNERLDTEYDELATEGKVPPVKDKDGKENAEGVEYRKKLALFATELNNEGIQVKGFKDVVKIYESTTQKFGLTPKEAAKEAAKEVEKTKTTNQKKAAALVSGGNAGGKTAAKGDGLTYEQRHALPLEAQIERYFH